MPELNPSLFFACRIIVGQTRSFPPSSSLPSSALKPIFFLFFFFYSIIRLRSEFFLPPSTILLANLSNVPSTSTANITPTSLSVSFSSDPADNARAAYKFLSRRAVDGYVESQHAVLAALSSSRSRNEKGRVELLLQGFCDHNRRNSRNVEERLDRLEAVSLRIEGGSQKLGDGERRELIMSRPSFPRRFFARRCERERFALSPFTNTCILVPNSLPTCSSSSSQLPDFSAEFVPISPYLSSSFSFPCPLCPCSSRSIFT